MHICNTYCTMQDRNTGQSRFIYECYNNFWGSCFLESGGVTCVTSYKAKLDSGLGRSRELSSMDNVHWTYHCMHMQYICSSVYAIWKYRPIHCHNNFWEKVGKKMENLLTPPLCILNTTWLPLVRFPKHTSDIEVSWRI